jgi:hypothetical protein
MKFKAIITQRDGEKIILELSCREYHAQKLNYILSRTLDRSVYLDAAVVACDAAQVDAEPARRTRNTRAPLLDLSTVEKICNQGGKR